MKINIFILLILGSAINISCFDSKTEKNYLTENNLKGKVKLLRKVTFSAIQKFGKIYKGKKEDDYCILLNKKGNILEEMIYNSDGTLTYKEVYRYDDNGNLIEDDSKYDFDEISFFNHKYKYDKYNKPVELDIYNSDGTLDEKYTYKYNEIQELIEWNCYNSDGTLRQKETYKYETKGNLVELKKYNSDGTLAHGVTYKYEFDKTGNWTKRTKVIGIYPRTIIEREIEYY